jgi:nucleoside-diphosphate-sugar epimerase
MESGHEVTAIRRKSSEAPIPFEKSPVWLQRNLEEVTATDLQGHDVLVHFAAQGVSPQQTDWDIAFDVNVRQSIRLFDLAAKSGIAHLLSCGSCFEYGMSGERYDFIPADAPLEPVGPYATSKAAFSFAVQSMARSTSAAITVVRPFHLFGEGQHGSNFWPSLRSAALSGENFPMTMGEQIRDYMQVERAAEAFLEIATRPPVAPRFRAINIGSGIPISLKDFASYWWNKWQPEGQLNIGALPYRNVEVMRFVPQITSC